MLITANKQHVALAKNNDWRGLVLWKKYQKKPKHKTNITEWTIDTSPARLLTHFAACTVQADTEKAKDAAKPSYYSLWLETWWESD